MYLWLQIFSNMQYWWCHYEHPHIHLWPQYSYSNTQHNGHSRISFYHNQRWSHPSQNMSSLSNSNHTTLYSHTKWRPVSLMSKRKTVAFSQPMAASAKVRPTYLDQRSVTWVSMPCLFYGYYRPDSKRISRSGVPLAASAKIISHLGFYAMFILWLLPT